MLRLDVTLQAATVAVRAAASDVNPMRQVLSGVVSGIYKATATFSAAEPGLSPVWSAIKRLDEGGLKDALRNGGDVNERNGNGGGWGQAGAGRGGLVGGPAGAPAPSGQVQLGGGGRAGTPAPPLKGCKAGATWGACTSSRAMTNTR